MRAIPAQSTARSAKAAAGPGWDGNLRKHADYQRVYREGKRQSLPLMTYFFAARSDAIGPAVTLNGMGGPPAELRRESRLGPRVGLTAGKVLGNAVERNRIKRRMREAIRHAQSELTASVDVVLHPRRAVLEAKFSAIQREVERAFRAVQLAVQGQSGPSSLSPRSQMRDPFDSPEARSGQALGHPRNGRREQ